MTASLVDQPPKRGKQFRSTVNLVEDDEPVLIFAKE